MLSSSSCRSSSEIFARFSLCCLGGGAFLDGLIFLSAMAGSFLVDEVEGVATFFCDCPVVGLGGCGLGAGGCGEDVDLGDPCGLDVPLDFVMVFEIKVVALGCLTVLTIRVLCSFFLGAN